MGLRMSITGSAGEAVATGENLAWSLPTPKMQCAEQDLHLDEAWPREYQSAAAGCGAVFEQPDWRPCGSTSSRARTRARCGTTPWGRSRRESVRVLVHLMSNDNTMVFPSVKRSFSSWVQSTRQHVRSTFKGMSPIFGVPALRLG